MKFMLFLILGLSESLVINISNGSLVFFTG